MGKTNRYELDGEVLEIPLRWDERTQNYVEDYEEYYDGPAYTPAGRPILLTIEDACPHAEMMDDDPAGIDCGSCRHYHQFPGSLLGVCTNDKRRVSGKGRGAATGTREEEPI